MITIAILEDDPLVIDAFRKLSPPEVALHFTISNEPVGTEKIYEKWAADVTRLQPDLLLLDIMLLGMNELGLELAERSLEAFGHIPVVLMSGNANPLWIARARRIGARGFLDKSDLVAHLTEPDLVGQESEMAAMCTAILERDEDFYISTQQKNKLVDKYLAQARPQNVLPSITLDEEEKQIIRLYALGYMRSEIEKELNIEKRRFEGIRKRLVARLGLRHREIADNPRSGLLVAYAVKHGLIDLPF